MVKEVRDDDVRALRGSAADIGASEQHTMTNTNPWAYISGGGRGKETVSCRPGRAGIAPVPGTGKCNKRTT